MVLPGKLQTTLDGIEMAKLLSMFWVSKNKYPPGIYRLLPTHSSPTIQPRLQAGSGLNHHAALEEAGLKELLEK